jgi:hypothetical protein
MFAEVAAIKLVAELIEVIVQILLCQLMVHIQSEAVDVADSNMHPRKYLWQVFRLNHLCLMRFYNMLQLFV